MERNIHDTKRGVNGNLTLDNHKGLSFSYNYLNLPSYIFNTGGSDITLTYTADGEKLTKVSSAGTRSYVSGIEYLGTNLEAIYHGEGRCTPNGAAAFHYEYTIKDHLGNARVNFRANGAAVTYLEDMHYYPFGMLMEGMGTNSPANDYTYNGKELNEDLGLNLSDYGARWYDAALGRWWSVDPMGEVSINASVYAYVLNNPMILIDPTGMFGYPFRTGTESWAAITAASKMEVAQRELTRQVEKGLQSTVHVVPLKGSDKGMVDEAIKQLRGCAEAAGLNVAFKKENPNSFDITRMPVSDAVAVVGKNNSDAADYILENFDKGYLSKTFKDRLPNFRNASSLFYPEISDKGDSGWGYVIATSTNMGKTTVKMNGVTYTGSVMSDLGVKTKSDALALTIFHGMGHTSGLYHDEHNLGIMRAGSQIFPYMFTHKGNLVEAIKHTMITHPVIKNAFNKRYNINIYGP